MDDPRCDQKVAHTTGGVWNNSVASGSIDAMSIVIDPYGRSLAEAGTGETMNANAILDIGALRASRQKTGMTHVLSRLPMAALKATYASQVLAEPNRLAGGRMADRTAALGARQSVIDRLVAQGLFTKES